MKLCYKIQFIIFLLLPSVSSFAQRNEEVGIAVYKPRFVSLSPSENTHTPSFPVTGIVIFDMRFDTSNTGLLQNSVLGKEKLLHFKKGTCHEVKEFCESDLVLTPSGSSDRGITLACFIKKLFISDNIYLNDGKKVSANDVNFEVKSGIMTVLEFYAQREDSFIPLYRFDSTITGKKDVYRFADEYISNILSASLRKMESLDWERIFTNVKPKKLSEINTHYNARFNIPILKELPKRGLYLSFDHFKKNNPLDTAFTVDKTKKGDFLYVKNKKGEDILQTELWGYCDGKNMYVFSAENYFQLYRQDNTFLVYGAKDFTSVRRLGWNFGLLDMAMPNSNYAKGKTTNSYQLEFNLLQLDMESGELY
jgi:hypothetical protein